MNTDKKGARLIAKICRQQGIRHVVFSPGSRSAPLVIAFSAMPGVQCVVIPDERVAGYFALGMAQQLRSPVAIVCTSGTAVLNLGPAVTEAFYQHIPLLLLTADRPPGASDQGENQAIEQAFVFEKLTKGSYDVNGDAADDAGLQKVQTDIELAIERTHVNGHGPVHVNIRMSEPLYNFADEGPVITSDGGHATFQRQSEDEALQVFASQLATAKKKMVIIGLRPYNKHFENAIEAIALRRDTVVLTETASNTVSDNCIGNYDACIELLDTGITSNFVPDMVITLGNQIISKRIRQLLRKHNPRAHWDISPENTPRNHNLFNCGTQPHFITENDALLLFAQSGVNEESNYAGNWRHLNQQAIALTGKYCGAAQFSDFVVFETLVKTFPENSNVHYANSSPIRYANFFGHSSSLRINSNRGASGIDGCVSTAAGAAFVNKKLTICVTGDIGFFYDSNALFNNNLSADLRIIIINNGGGNIFRLIEGPGKVRDFEKFFETPHNLHPKFLALMYGLPYYFCDTLNGLENVLPDFYKPQNGRPAILEIVTNNEVSEQVFKGYFNFLKENR